MQNFPEIINFLVTSKCNRQCQYCFDPKGIPGLDLSKIKKIFQLFSQRGVRGVVISGGEPLLRQDICDIFRELRQHNIRIYLDTNGDLFVKYRTAINLYVDVLGLPLDHPTSPTSLTTLRILEYYKNKPPRKRPKIKIGTVASRPNMNQLDQIGRILVNYPIDIWKIYQYTPGGSLNEGDQENLSITKREFLRHTHLLRSRYSCYFEVLVSPRSIRHCAYFMVDPDGMVVMPFDNGTRCQRNLLGHIFDQDIIAKWQTLVYEKNYLNNTGPTLFYEWESYPTQPIYNQIYYLAQPYYQRAQFYTQAHIDWLVRESLTIAKQERVDERILIPLVVLHDIGYSQIAKSNPYTLSSRIGHMQAGAKLARDILTRVSYPEELKQKVVYYVSRHDAWSLGQHEIYNQDKTFGVYEDLDYLSMFSDRHFAAISQLLKKTPEHTLEFITGHEKLINRPFHSQSTRKLFEEYAGNKRLEIYQG